MLDHIRRTERSRLDDERHQRELGDAVLFGERLQLPRGTQGGAKWCKVGKELVSRMRCLSMRHTCLGGRGVVEVCGGGV